MTACCRLLVGERTLQLRVPGVAPDVVVDWAEDLAQEARWLACQAAKAGCGEVEVRLLPPLVQLRRLSRLPPVPPRELRALVRHSAGRFFRAGNERLVTDACWICANEEGPRVARAAAVDECLLLSLCENLESKGLHVREVTPEVPDEGRTLDLRPEVIRRKRFRESAGGLARLALACVIVWVAGFLLAAGKVALEDRRLARELQELEQPLVLLAGLRQEVRESGRAIAAIHSSHTKRWDMVVLLSALAGALPDDAFLRSVELDSARSGSLTVVSPAAASVPGALARDPRLGRPRLDGSVAPENTVWGRQERAVIRLAGKTDE